MHLYSKILLCFLFLPNALLAQEKVLNLNKPEREAWFTELGFGMFIHWSVDVQYGYNISHSLRLASDDYIERYFTELPKTFDPQTFNPRKWAKMAKMAGMNYVVFTAKHHNGFCMWDTQTTPFGIMNTPFKRDITKEVIDAFRAENIAIGIYFSPDDFWFIRQQGQPITRNNPSALARNNTELNDYAKKQLRELLTNYGNIDILFLDGNDQFGKTELAKVAWEINPEIVVTRGAMETPEQTLPDEALPSPWEACYTLGDSWSYRPTYNNYKSAREVILKWVEIKAKGGNFLLNVAPDAEGEISQEQKAVLNEVGAWWFINQEVMKNTVPVEGQVQVNGNYLLKNMEQDALYIVSPDSITYRQWRNITMPDLSVNAEATASLLGHSTIVSEGSLKEGKNPVLQHIEEGISIKYRFMQRIHNDYKVDFKWNNPLVFKIENYAVDK